MGSANIRDARREGVSGELAVGEVVADCGKLTADSWSGARKCVALWGQATKCMWWMPWRSQAMKDVAACEKLRGAGKRALIRRYPNGETRPARVTPA